MNSFQEEAKKHQLILWPDERLLKPSLCFEPLQTEGFEELVEIMKYTMEKKNGLGLSAVQIGVHLRVFVGKIGSETWVFANPSWAPVEGSESRLMTEGCLSTPGIFQKISRVEWINCLYQDEAGIWRTGTFNGIESEMIQHECEHLDGKMFLDYLPESRQKTIRTKMLRLKAGG